MAASSTQTKIKSWVGGIFSFLKNNPEYSPQIKWFMRLMTFFFVTISVANNWSIVKTVLEVTPNPENPTDLQVMLAVTVMFTVLALEFVASMAILIGIFDEAPGMFYIMAGLLLIALGIDYWTAVILFRGILMENWSWNIFDPPNPFFLALAFPWIFAEILAMTTWVMSEIASNVERGVPPDKWPAHLKRYSGGAKPVVTAAPSETYAPYSGGMNSPTRALSKLLTDKKLSADQLACAAHAANFDETAKLQPYHAYLVIQGFGRDKALADSTEGKAIQQMVDDLLKSSAASASSKPAPIKKASGLFASLKNSLHEMTK